MFKVWVLASGESTFATNGLEFDTIKESVSYAHNLMSRWYAVERFVVLPLNDKYSGFVSVDTAESNAVAQG